MIILRSLGDIYSVCSTMFPVINVNQALCNWNFIYQPIVMRELKVSIWLFVKFKPVWFYELKFLVCRRLCQSDQWLLRYYSGHLFTLPPPPNTESFCNLLFHFYVGACHKHWHNKEAVTNIAEMCYSDIKTTLVVLIKFHYRNIRHSRKSCTVWNTLC